jgi:hypothetical protein
MMARVRGVIAASSLSRSMLRVTGIDVGEHRGGADFDDHVGGGRPGNRRGDHFVARPDAGDAQGDLHGAGAGIEGAYRAAAEVLGQQASKAWFFGPLVIQPERSTSPTAAMVSSSMVGRENGRKGSSAFMESSWFLGWLLGEAIGLPSDIYSKRAL